MKIVLLVLLNIFIGVLNAEITYAQTSLWEKINGNRIGGAESFAVNSQGHIYACESHSGVFCSTDNGFTWKRLNTNFTINDQNLISIDKNGYIFVGFTHNLFRSTDNGVTWEKINYDLPEGFTDINSICFNINGDIYIGTWEGVFKSSNNGANWISVNRGIDGSDLYINSLVCNPNGNVFASAGSHVYRSSDNGQNWTRVNTGLTETIFHLANKTTGEIFGCSQFYVYVTTNNGGNWNKTTMPPTGVQINDIKINSQGYLFVVNNVINRSNNDGNTWEIITPPYTSVSRLLLNNSNDTIFYIGGNVNQLFRSIDNGKTWEILNSTLYSREDNGSNCSIASITIKPTGNIYVGTYTGKVFVSTDGGENWFLINRGLTTNLTIQTLIIDNKGYIYAGNDDGIFQLTNGGDIWTKVNDGLINTKVRAIAINKNGEIFVGIYGGGVFKSTNDGNSWTPINNGLTNTDILSIAINSKGHIFAGTKVGGVFRSTDNGENWSEINIGLMEYDVHSIVIDTRDNIFLLAPSLYRSTDNGNNWLNMNNNGRLTGGVLALNSTGSIFHCGFGTILLSKDDGKSWTEDGYFLANCFAFNSEGYLFAGIGDGVMMRTESTLTFLEENKYQIPSKFYLSQNYPNPFNPNTTIEFLLPNSENVILKVYNSLGQEVETLVSEYKSPGNYKVQFHGSNHPSGIYFYQLHAGKFRETKKIVLLK